MGTLIGHVAPGFGFLLIGLWHLFNHTKLWALSGPTHTPPPWFPTTSLRHLELYLILLGSSLSFSVELFIAPNRHTPFSPNGSIPSNHLHNFEHSSISLSFFVYAASALLFDLSLPLRRRAAANRLLHLLAGISFANQLLVFRLHSADHAGVEGQYHWLLQIVIGAALGATLLGVAWDGGFLVAYTRSLCLVLMGAWLVMMGVMLWTPGFIPVGCFMNREEGHVVVRCDGDEALDRAKALVNIVFSWFLIGVATFATSFYLVMMWVYGGVDVEYLGVGLEEEVDVEAQRGGK